MSDIILQAIKKCINKYTEMLIDEYHLRTDLQIANIKRLEQKFLAKMAKDFIDLQPTADVVEVDKVAEMFAEQFGDKCPCNFNDNDEWLTLYCDYTNTGDCPCKDGWKQFVKHYDKRKEQEE